MKAILFTLLLLSLTTAHAQRVAADAVPDAVKAAFAREHAGKSVTWWERKPWNPTEHYEAVVLQPKLQTLRARYLATGEALYTSVFYPAGLVPTAIKAKVGAANPGFTIAHAVELTSARRGQFFYVWLRRPGENRGLYVTPEGEPVAKDRVAAEWKDVEAQSN